MKIKRKKLMGLGLHSGAPRHKGGLSSEDRLNVYWYRHKDLLAPNNLIDIVVKESHPLLRKRALAHFLVGDDTDFDQCHHMLNASWDLLQESKFLSNQLHQKMFVLANENQLVELIYEGNVKAAVEFFKKVEEIIRTGKPVKGMGPRKAKRILMELFAVMTMEKERKRLWGYIKKLNPETEELINFLDREGMGAILRAVPEISGDITRILKRNRKQDEKKREIIRTLKKLAVK